MLTPGVRRGTAVHITPTQTLESRRVRPDNNVHDVFSCFAHLPTILTPTQTLTNGRYPYETRGYLLLQDFSAPISSPLPPSLWFSRGETKGPTHT